MSLGFLPGHRNVIFGDLKHSFVSRLVFAIVALRVDMNVVDSQGNCPLWQALDSGQEDIAHIVVSQ